MEILKLSTQEVHTQVDTLTRTERKKKHSRPRPTSVSFATVYAHRGGEGGIMIHVRLVVIVVGLEGSIGLLGLDGAVCLVLFVTILD